MTEQDNYVIPPSPIRFTSFLGDNGQDFYRRVTAYLGQTIGLPTEFISNLSSDEQERQVQQEAIQIVFTCGLPYVKKADCDPPLLQLLAAPVLTQPRYQDQPVYYSDVIVRAGSSYQKWDDLRGTVFAYNEIHSFSGYMLPRYRLLTRGEDDSFFSQNLPSGTHANSMDWVEQGRADTAAIDSVVFDMEMDQRPERANVFRVIERLGPNAMPPVAAVSNLSKDICRAIQTTLLAMHLDEQGRALLKEAGMKRFAAVTNSDYNSIRQILHELTQSG